MQPHRRQPTKLRRPWDSPGKNTGVGCHFLLQCMKVKSESKVTQSCPTLSDPMDSSLPGSSIHGIFQARVLEWGAIGTNSNLDVLALESMCCEPSIQPFTVLCFILIENLDAKHFITLFNPHENCTGKYCYFLNICRWGINAQGIISFASHTFVNGEAQDSKLGLNDLKTI